MAIFPLAVYTDPSFIGMTGRGGTVANINNLSASVYDLTCHAEERGICTKAVQAIHEQLYR